MLEGANRRHTTMSATVDTSTVRSSLDTASGKTCRSSGGLLASLLIAFIRPVSLPTAPHGIGAASRFWRLTQSPASPSPLHRPSSPAQAPAQPGPAGSYASE